MGRRGYMNRLPEQRSSIGDIHVEEAVTLINRTAMKAAAVMTSYTIARDDTLRMLFSDNVLMRAAAAKDIIEPMSVLDDYPVAQDVRLYVNFADSRYPTISDKALTPQPDLIQPLLTYVEQVKAIYHSYEQVKAVLRWLNRNATPGAIRYYWPTALTLCPKAPSLLELQHVPSRFTNPLDVGGWLQAFKDTAATMAGSAMLPSEAQPTHRKQMWLTFAQTTVQVGPGTSYRTDGLQFNI